jgi:hypothetical protein
VPVHFAFSRTKVPDPDIADALLSSSWNAVFPFARAFVWILAPLLSVADVDRLLMKMRLLEYGIVNLISLAADRLETVIGI